MDDPRFEPRLLARLLPFAWSAVAGSPTRAKPGRPIRYTPSGGELVAPPPRAIPAPPRPSASAWLARAGTWLLLAIGWLVFAGWWAIVLLREPIPALASAIALLAAIVVGVIVLMMLWTRHNIRLARNGKRGSGAVQVAMRWEHDTLGRRIVMPVPEVAQTAAEVRIVLGDGVKTYVAESEAQP